eukprot:2488690-Amphidinium_carterae.1
MSDKQHQKTSNIQILAHSLLSRCELAAPLVPLVSTESTALGALAVWDPHACSPRRCDAEVHSAAITCIAAHPAEAYVAVGSEDTTCKISQVECTRTPK